MTKKLRRPGTDSETSNAVDAKTEMAEISAPSKGKVSRPPLSQPSLPVAGRPAADRPAWPTTPLARVAGPPNAETFVNAFSTVEASETETDEQSAKPSPPVMPLPGVFQGLPPLGNGLTASSPKEMPAPKNGNLAAPVEMRATRPATNVAAEDSWQIRELETQVAELVVTQRRLTQAIPWLGVGIALSLILSGGAMYRAGRNAAAISAVMDTASLAPATASRYASKTSSSRANSVPAKRSAMPVKRPTVSAIPARKPVAPGGPVVKAVADPPIVSSSGPTSAQNDGANFILNANALGTDFNASPPPKKH